MISKWFIIRRIGLVGAFFVGFAPVMVVAIAQALFLVFGTSMQSSNYGYSYGYYGAQSAFFFAALGIGFGVAIVSGIASLFAAFIYNLIARVFPFKIRIDIAD